MDSYANKFASMQQYVPFLDRMIRKLEKCKDREKQAQLEKMKSLYGILTDPSKKVRFEVLLKCEEVLQKLYEKVEGVGEPGGETRQERFGPPQPQPQQRQFSPHPPQHQHQQPGRSRDHHSHSHSPDPGIRGGHRGRGRGGDHRQQFGSRKGVGLLGDAPAPPRPDPWGGHAPPGGPQRPPGPRGFPPGGGHPPPWQHRHPSVPPPGPGPWQGGGGRMLQPRLPRHHEARRQMGPGPGGWGGEGFGRGGGGGPRGGYRGGHQGRPELEERRPVSQEREDESPTSPGAAETPHSPSSPDKLDRVKPRSIPLESDVKSIPLERDEDRLSFSKPAAKPKLSEEERKRKLLKLQMKMAGKSSKEISENLSAVAEQSGQQPAPDSQKAEVDTSVTSSASPRPSWLSPPGPDSPPSLSIAISESPMSPDTQTASPQQQASPDTGCVSPAASHQSPSSSNLPDTPASPPASPEPGAGQGAPLSPDQACPQYDEPLVEIPIHPVTSAPRPSNPAPAPAPVPVPAPRKREDPRRRDPRQRAKSPPAPAPKLSPYDPNIAGREQPSSSSGQEAGPGRTPAYMSNIVSSLAPRPPHPAWQRPPHPAPPQPPRYGVQPSSSRPPGHYPQMLNRLPGPHQQQQPPLRPGPMIIEPHHQPPPSKPTSYREYRRLKEEAEKKRREFEERIRKEEKARQEAEDKAREALEEKEKEKVNEEQQECVAEPVKADSHIVVSKASESKQVTSSSKPKEFKDPRRRKMMEEKEKKSSKVQEITEEPSSRPPETMKSFKIPKVKKIDKSETQSKLTEVDLFQSTEKVKNVKVAEEKSSGDKAAKVKDVVKESDAEISAHHHGDTDSDSEPSLQIAEDSEERERRRSSASESDSEVKQDARKRRKLSVEKEKVKEDESSDKNQDNSNISSEDVKDEEEGSFTKNELTKELLKSIVSSLDPKEATKLLEKAANMKRDDKISIETLKELIDSKEEKETNVLDEDQPLSQKRKRGRPKTPTKEKSAKKPKAAETKGSRRSRRLLDDDEGATVPPTEEQADDLVVDTVEEDLASEAPESQHETEEYQDECETFVIEPKAVAKKEKKKRGRKPKKGVNAVESIEEVEKASGLQDDSISSSNIEDISQDVKEEVKQEPIEDEDEKVDIADLIADEDLKMEEDVGHQDEEVTVSRRLSGGQEPSGMRQTRAMKTKMQKNTYTKTWKPSSEVCKPDNEFTMFRNLKSPPLTENPVKKENVQADLKVFLGEGEVAGEQFSDNKFDYSKGTLDSYLKENIKSRRSALSNLFDKFAKKPESKTTKEPQKEEVKRRKSVEGDKEKLSSKIKFRKPPTDQLGKALAPALLKPELEMKHVTLSTKLSETVKNAMPSIAEDEDLKQNEDQKVDENFGILEIINKLKKRQQVPPALIPLDSQETAVKTLDIDPSQLEMFSRETVVPDTEAAHYKTPEAYSELLRPERLVHLFKCMQPSCSFSCSSAAEFVAHVAACHGDQTAWLRCCYCLGRVRSVARLVSHVIRHHGHARYQCPHCFFRAGSLAELLLHQNIHHAALARGFLLCDHLAAAPDTAPRVTTSAHTRVRCLAASCEFECEAGARRQVEQHRWAHFPPAQLLGFCCPYCGFSSARPCQVVVHQAACHPGAPPRIHMTHLAANSREELSEDSSEDTDLESEGDSELSDFDKHFYDDDDGDLLGGDLKLGPGGGQETGLRDQQLYRCGNIECSASASSAAEFREHLLHCPHSDPLHTFSCYHCHAEHNHLNSLMEHLKTHALKRYLCSLCDFKDPLMNSLKVHVKAEHKLLNFKFVPLHSAKNNPEKDYFLVVPKNNLQKSGRSKALKDTFSPADIASIPLKPDIYKYILRCSLCDYGTRVRNNLVKHLKLHLKEDSAAPNVLCPVNPPPVDEGDTSALSRMTSLLPDDIDEELKRKPISFAELEQLPRFVPENMRFACCAKDCTYITIDEAMLLYHIKALHKELRKYKCPHCPNVSVPFAEVGHHLKCHGELLFKCGHCDYFHPVKRTAEAHAATEHANRKHFVRNVREEEEKRRELGPEDDVKKEADKEAETGSKIVAVYRPYRCGFCEFSAETLAEMRDHCRTVHSLEQQYKCGLCSFVSDDRAEMEEHVAKHHQGGAAAIVRVFYVDPTTVLDAYPEEKRFPLWARDMEGLKHIRGILYDDLEDEAAIKQAAKESKARIRKQEEEIRKEKQNQEYFADLDTSAEEAKVANKVTAKSVKNELDHFPMSCKECGFHKKTVTGMKMHIKLNHLGVGKFQCRRCVFSANLTNSIQGHYRNKHPEFVSTGDQGQEVFEYAEKVASAQNFSEEFWKQEWNIPTLTERKALLANDPSSSKKRKKADVALESPPLKKKRGRKKGWRKSDQASAASASDTSSKPRPSQDEFESNILRADRELESAEAVTVQSTAATTSGLFDPKEVSQSPFESVRSFMCGYCPKRSQSLERIRRHLGDRHPGLEAEWQQLSRDQVVAIITSDQYAGSADCEYKCFYCQEVGSITKLYDHTEQSHASSVFRVVKFQGRGVTGYLECQVCGYLSPGFEKYLQKAHFHEEHPLEDEVNCSKYMYKMKAGTEAFSSNQQAFKFDVNDVVGMTFECPRNKWEPCSFTTQILSQMNTHLRKHTKTYKCGHCGKTFLDNSEFHRHSAMSHGDKIPDLVKDQEAEAAYEALKGLLEENILQRISLNKQQTADEDDSPDFSSSSRPASRLVARKSTGPDSRARPGDVCRNVAAKSTGPHAKFWPETRLEIPYSFYGIPPEPIDPKLIKTRMAMGGIEITLDAEKMGELINLEPKLVLDDCQQENVINPS